VRAGFFDSCSEMNVRMRTKLRNVTVPPLSSRAITSEFPQARFPKYDGPIWELFRKSRIS
jgi:hypothetical protein